MRMFKLTHTVLFITLVTGCANVDKTSTTAGLQQNKVTNIQISQRVNDAAAQVEQDYLKAKDENFTYYAPNTWRSIQKRLVSMRKVVNRFDPNDQGFFGGPSESRVLADIAEVSDALIKAQNTKRRVTIFLAQPLADIEYLAPKIDHRWQRDFTSIKQNIKRIINNIEINYAISRQEYDRNRLQKKIQTLEISIVTAEYYSPLEKQFDQLNKRLIPQSYNNVLQNIQKLNNVITTTPRDTATLTAAADLVKKGIQSAEHITKDVNWINSLDRRQREEIVLQYRTTLEGLGFKFIDQDLSTLSYKAQVSTFELALSAKLAAFETTDTEITLDEEQKIADNVDSKPESTPVESAIVETSPEDVPVKSTPVESDIAEASPEDVPVKSTPVESDITEASPEDIPVESTPVESDIVEALPADVLVETTTVTTS